MFDFGKNELESIRFFLFGDFVSYEITCKRDHNTVDSFFSIFPQRAHVRAFRRWNVCAC